MSEFIAGYLTKSDVGASQIIRYLQSSSSDAAVKALNLSTDGMVLTLFVNFVLFAGLLLFFEKNRFYKQIFLKRYQRRFTETSRVPPPPPDLFLGWLIAIYKIEEYEILTMVGLDAYMLMRFHVLCFKLSVFLSFWGLLVLVPTYGTAISDVTGWDQYTILNITKSNDYRPRLWVTAIMFYLFAAYFCQLLYAEYHNFSILRLQYLGKDDPKDDPDTPAQVYYTIMCEKIPVELRSADRLREYFEDLFPGEVYCIEVALDLRELNSLTSKRKSIRDKLERAIAEYHVDAPKRPLVVVKTGDIDFFNDLNVRLPHDNEKCCTWFSLMIKEICKKERYGYEDLDAINYYAAQLQKLNCDTEELQAKCFELHRNLDEVVQRKLKNKYDTRAAEMVEEASSFLKNVRAEGGIEKLLFGSSKKNRQATMTGASSFDELYLESDLPKTELFKDEDDEEKEHEVQTEHKKDTDVIEEADFQIKEESNFVVDLTDTSSKEIIQQYSETADNDNATTNPMHDQAITKNSTEDEGDGSYFTFENDRSQQDNDRMARMRRVSSIVNNNVGVERATMAARHGWAHTKLATIGAIRGAIEIERAFEMIVVGAYYKFSSTAFVTFKSRMAETIAHQMTLSDETSMSIHHAPNPKDIIWDNVAIPKTQIIMRNFITNCGLIVGSIFWSSLVASVDAFGKRQQLPESQQNFLSVCILLLFLVALPFVFDFLARNYEGMKLESEIQNAIMTRYFYYQLVNVFVTIGLGGISMGNQIFNIFRKPQVLIDLLGQTIPSVSLYFANLIIVKIFAAIPIEMLRPWQLSSILFIGTIMDRRKTTRRDLRTGAFFAWPMLYGWIYPQLMMVQMIIITYSCISPFLMPFGALFFAFAYIMYKYQLLYVYVNDSQSHGYMWYAVFNRSLVALLFATTTVLASLTVQLEQTDGANNHTNAGPFFFLLPLPGCIIYFWYYCDGVFKKKMDLSFQRAKFLDHVNESKKDAGMPIPQDTFVKHLFRQPTLTEEAQYPEQYRNQKVNSFFDEKLIRNRNRSKSQWTSSQPSSPTASPGRKVDIEYGVNRGRACSIDVLELAEEYVESLEELKEYFEESVLKTLVKPTTNTNEIYIDAKSNNNKNNTKSKKT